MSMSCDCSQHVDQEIDFYHEIFPVARKSYKCCECGEEIKPGEKHHKVTGKWDGFFNVYRTCIPCNNIRNHYCPTGFIFMMLRVTIEDCLGADYLNVPEEDEDDD